MDQNRMPLVEALQQFREEAPAYFRIPGHRFERGLDEALNGASLAAYDLSEAEGLDDLHHAEGVIAEAQRLAAETWKAKKTFFLVNGTTCGNEAMVLSSVKEGEKIIVPRNVHKSMLMGLILCGATPVYVMPEYSTKWQMWGGVTPETIEKAFAETPDAKAVLLHLLRIFSHASQYITNPPRLQVRTNIRCIFIMETFFAKSLLSGIKNYIMGTVR